jgi:hypothetical protein
MNPKNVQYTWPVMSCIWRGWMQRETSMSAATCRLRFALHDKPFPANIQITPNAAGVPPSRAAHDH